ncbi:universal stress protein [Actinomadura madurae]|uniref:universal stress protein n=1 Tax=Actinomadura madurae TaxID=1993 RepID=UPI003FD8C23B
MSAYRIVLVGTDGSDSSFRAVDRAAQLAAATGATLLLASAYSPMPERERASAADRLGDLAYKVQGSTPADDALRAARERAVAAAPPTSSRPPWRATPSTCCPSWPRSARWTCW